MGNRLNVG
ncbi:hypothetical protein CP8484711_1057, partial [Chlamydia psittaci 84-8471/1]